MEWYNVQCIQNVNSNNPGDTLQLVEQNDTCATTKTSSLYYYSGIRDLKVFAICRGLSGHH